LPRSVNCLHAAVDVELAENIPVVVSDCIDTDNQPFGNLLVFVAFASSANLDFTFTKRFDRRLSIDC
jgi:hypothetical protein